MSGLLSVYRDQRSAIDVQLEGVEGQEQSELRMTAMQLKKKLQAKEMNGEGEMAAH